MMASHECHDVSSHREIIVLIEVFGDTEFLDVVKMTSSSVASGEDIAKMMPLLFQWMQLIVCPKTC